MSQTFTRIALIAFTVTTALLLLTGSNNPAPRGEPISAAEQLRRACPSGHIMIKGRCLVRR